MPYSIDLRTKIFDAYQNGEGSYRDLAQRFNVSLSFIYSLFKLFKETKNIKPKHGGGKKPLIDEDGYCFIRKLVLSKPDITLQEICDEYEKNKKIKLSISVMCVALKKLNFNRKKKLFTP